jgi:isopentenyldiphosphate isomerase
MKIPIVNEEDEIVGYKDREDRNSSDIIRITSIWITDENGNVLLQQRNLNKKYNPGKWGPAVAGTVEEGETYESNAYKEMKEEIGIEGIKLKESKKFYGETTVNVGKRFCQLYTAQIPRIEELVIQEDEVEQVKWFTKDELLEFFKEKPDNFVGAMKDFIKLFFDEV